ncbi:hypothetical protein C1H46_022236 [Malus baccata]|uniref:Uncharacterized protein n=1 Tax=Malus baccata TaxID=106549 RepID=A0A540M066_MALBA|nr:hypothetical protein C1H46_022236 [Malus baccata]
MAVDASAESCLQTELADGLADSEENHGGLAGTGLSLGNDIAALNDEPDSSLLDDGGGRVEARTK